MDVYGTAATAITQVYKVTVFIQGVISDIKAFDDDRAEIRLKLNVQLITLHFFKRIFFRPEHGLMLPGKLEPFIVNTVEGLLVQMRKTLAEYELVAAKYGLVGEEDTEENEWTAKESLLERAKAKVKSLKMKGYDWSLFDKKRLNRILEAYTTWSKDLQNVMQHMSQDTLAKLAESDSQGLKSSGLEPVVKRRMLVEAKAPDSYCSLSGEIVEEGKSTGGFQLGKWSTSSAESMQVLIEYHEYESILKQEDLEPDEIKEYKEPIRNLAWLLQNTTFAPSATADSLDQPRIYALECLGFIDQPEHERSVFLYRLPPSDTSNSSPITLHAFINAIDSDTKRPLKKPSLNDRFSVAHSLALTLSNLHASSWLHKNIWSRGILLFLQSETGITTSGIYERRLSATQSRSGQIVAYLGDWGYARSVQQGTDMRSDFEVEPNLYRHPNRQGKPTHQFQRLHDIYALGVVLLEIGLWVTLSRLMEPKIREAQRSGRLPPRKKVLEDLLGLAVQGLPKEMGMGYTKAVLACLRGQFRAEDGPSLALDFQEKVVDVLASGVDL
ncbi:uncharacterized protein ACLA_097190 [Aspergillus clavatus NRRL 1]|uniref:Protein kinase domain-containing protein n=1 Tax=Aspergillus clavatus (strain ATCC 1007 / CBS 513.65 / DSM 816 / NCTC 3887 / NRRL 1 / QM 1276 / 107) TaxID=344612 RepID=A1CMJ4_ASPCL|nr:uncharacterized protein ACLA_097190 [Aspergillus clavatus NRRL 1]EAW08781.1 conserved hypothetical protein [Aspergillus clavatus NRRL 1]